MENFKIHQNPKNTQHSGYHWTWVASHAGFLSKLCPFQLSPDGDRSTCSSDFISQILSRPSICPHKYLAKIHHQYLYRYIYIYIYLCLYIYMFIYIYIYIILYSCPQIWLCLNWTLGPRQCHWQRDQRVPRQNDGDNHHHYHGQNQ